MSEYQYYEFLAIDRPLTSGEQKAVRAFSTRAEISATRFSNEYQWGDFKGDPREFVQHWYDAHVYFANWGTRRFMFRVPADLIDLTLAKCCLAYKRDEGAATLHLADGFAIIDLVAGEEESMEYEDYDTDWMNQLTPVRDELLRDDPRVLYLAWLLRVQYQEVDRDEPEPFLPPGLANLSPALKSLVDFLMIDDDLLTVAAEESAPLPKAENDDAALAAWIRALPQNEKDDALVAICTGEDPAAPARLRRRFKADCPSANTSPGRRTAGQLLDAADRGANRRRLEEEERAVRKKAAAKAEADRLRNQHLDQLAATKDHAWRQVRDLVNEKKPKSYDQATKLLLDLHALASRDGHLDEFKARIAHLRADHAFKPRFIERLKRSRLD